MRKKLEGLGVVLIFCALAFLVYRDVSENVRLTIGVPALTSGAQTTTEPPAARTAVDAWCREQKCTQIVFLGGAPETATTYEIAIYVISAEGDRGTAYVPRLVLLEAGEVKGIR